VIFPHILPTKPDFQEVLTLPDGVKVEIKPAKGRPMLTWVGKRPLRQVLAFPAQHIETFNPNPGGASVPGRRQAWSDWPSAYPRGGLLFHGDNKEVMAYLLANGFRGKVKLIYIDPPFDSGANYVRKVTLRGVKGAAKIEGEGYTLGEQIQYTDIWANDNYLQFMYERLLLIKELLAEDSSIFLHCDQRRVHHLRCLMDEVFGADNFINEIIWMHQIMGGSHEKRFPKAHETILWYSKGSSYRIRTEDPNVRVPFSEYVLNSMKQDENGRWYYERRRMSRKATAEEAASKAHTRTYVETPEEGTVATDVWDDMLSYQELPNERQGLDLFPTQKTVKSLTRLISAASDPGDLILDSFMGSGTTAVVAQKLGRRWLGCDINKGAIQTTCKRLQNVILKQMEVPKKKKKQLPLPPAGKETQDNSDPSPAQLSFAVYRVNDYDLAIQHNEAVNLACEHLGVTRTKTDAFFDGTMGKKLVKIVPFGHPLTLLDLEEIKRELSARPEEERDICVVCLGKETAADGWLEDWNRLRKQGDVPNKIEVIELRTDPRYGKFFVHQPATARVSITRDQGKIRVEIQDFISSTIIERLKQQSGLLSPQIDDWRAMVDSVMIDPAYNGEVFNVVLADVPHKKSDLVSGSYQLAAPSEESTIAVKVTDMLGEEVLITQKI
jgi:DNA modification methylase